MRLIPFRHEVTWRGKPLSCVRVWIVAVVCFSATMTMAVPAWSAPEYSARQIPPVTSGGGATAYSINLKGHATGDAPDSTAVHRGFFYDGSTSRAACGLYRGLGVNYVDTIAGELMVKKGKTNEQHAATCAGMVVKDLGTLGGSLASATAINDSGQVVGMSWLAGASTDHAFIYSGGVMRDLGTALGASDGYDAKSVNSYGVVTGFRSDAAHVWHAFRWDATTGLSNVGPAGSSSGWDINDSGDIAGAYNGSPAVFTAAGLVSTLPLLPGTNGGMAEAINNAGEIVGQDNIYPLPAFGPQRKPFLLSDGVMYDLSSLIPGSSGLPLDFAYDINDAGQIIAVDATGKSYVLSLTRQGALDRFRPTLRLDFTEQYRPDSPGEMTDNFGSDYSNKLKNSNGTILASPGTDWPGVPLLSLNYLGPNYPDGTPSFPQDYIDAETAPNGSYYDDYYRMHPAYADRSYAQLWIDSTTGDRYAQYWFFYYDNPKTFAGFGDHEGDWEMVQVHLSPLGLPIRASYSEHRTQMTCEWPSMEAEGTHALVYVAEGSHANYFHQRMYPLGFGFTDQAFWQYNGFTGGVVRPSLTDMSDVVTEPGWFKWSGHWGGTFKSGNPYGFLESDSPAGPLIHDQQWNRPNEWETRSDRITCSSQAMMAAPSTGVALPEGGVHVARRAPVANHAFQPPHAESVRPLPKQSQLPATITAKTRFASGVTEVRYCLGGLSKVRPYTALVRLDPSSSRKIPYVARFQRSTRCGVVRIRPPWKTRPRAGAFSVIDSRGALIAFARLRFA